MTDDRLLIGDAVLEALEKSLQNEGPCRLYTSGKKSGLFQGKKGSAALNQAIIKCTTLNLFTISEVDEPKAKTVEVGTITRDGLQVLFQHRTPEQRQELLEKCANPHKELAQDVLLTVTEQELQQLGAQQATLNQRASHLRMTLQRIIEEQLTVVEQSRTLLNAQHAALQNLIDGITRPQSEVFSTAEPHKGMRSLPKSDRTTPKSDGDIDFQMQLCRELVFAWQDESDPQIRSALEPAMLNSGLEPVGEVGETVFFDNRDHRSDSNVMPGQAAVVIERGWMLTSPRGTRLISPIQVEAAAKEGDAIHEAHAQH